MWCIEDSFILVGMGILLNHGYLISQFCSLYIDNLYFIKHLNLQFICTDEIWYPEIIINSEHRFLKIFLIIIVQTSIISKDGVIEVVFIHISEFHHSSINNLFLPYQYRSLLQMLTEILPPNHLFLLSIPHSSSYAKMTINPYISMFTVAKLNERSVCAHVYFYVMVLLDLD